MKNYLIHTNLIMIIVIIVAHFVTNPSKIGWCLPKALLITRAKFRAVVYLYF